MADIKGFIRFQNKVQADKHECLGCVRVNGNKFKVLISRESAEDIETFTETIFHELLHLAFFVIGGITKNIYSEKQQHRIINSIMPRILMGIKGD